MYRGRFAPSPTGPLHLGSLVAAAASYVDALAHGGEWLVRMEDVDEPRCSAAHAATILRQLESFGFAWQGPVMVQSKRKAAYQEALDRLPVYPCGCSRKELGGGEYYPGTCRDGLAAGRVARAWRVRVGEAVIEFDDRRCGPHAERLSESIGDFVLRRADGFFAYQLAVVVDDAEQGVTDVVRGEDLLGSTARQIFLQRALGYPTPRYLHVPLVLGADGQKLSKQTLAPAADSLRAAFGFLGLDQASDWAGAVEMWRARMALK